MQEELNGMVKRYAALSQVLFDAVVPFVTSYEAQCDQRADAEKDENEPQTVTVDLRDIRRAQSALRTVATDIYV